MKYRKYFENKIITNLKTKFKTIFNIEYKNYLNYFYFHIISK